MRTLEDRLTQASDEARLQVNQIDTRSASSIRSRQQRHRTLVAAAAVVSMFVVFGATAFVMSTETGQDSASEPSTSPTTAAPVAVAEASALPPAPIDITHLVGNITASSEVSAEYGATMLIDGDLERGWHDASLRGVGAEIVLEFTEPVAITEIIVHPYKDEERFARNYWVRTYDIRTNDLDLTIAGRFANFPEPQVVRLGTNETLILTFTVTTTYPAQPYGDGPPYVELAIAEIQVFGTTDGGIVVDDALAATTTTSIWSARDDTVASADADLRFFTGNDDELTWDWTAQVAALRADGNTTVHELNGISQKLAAVADAVPAIGDATVLMFESTEFYEEAFFVLEDGTDTMVYIGWQDYDGELHIRVPVIDGRFNVGYQDDILVADQFTENVFDFVADAGTQIVTVRFFQLTDTYGSVPLAGRFDPMVRIFNDVLATFDLPIRSEGSLLDGAGKGILPRSPLPTEIPVDLVASKTSASEAPPVFVCSVEPNRGEIIENSATFGTPTDALWGFLRESVSIEARPGFFTSGYTQMELPDGSIAFAKLFEGDETQSVTTVYITATDGTWAVAAWEGSGC